MKKTYKYFLVVSLAVLVLFLLFRSSEGFSASGSGSGGSGDNTGLPPNFDPKKAKGNAFGVIIGYSVKGSLVDIYNKFYKKMNLGPSGYIVYDCKNKIVLSDNDIPVSTEIKTYKIVHKTFVYNNSTENSFYDSKFSSANLKYQHPFAVYTFKSQIDLDLVSMIYSTSKNLKNDSDLEKFNKNLSSKVAKMSYKDFIKYINSSMTEFPKKSC